MPIVLQVAHASLSEAVHQIPERGTMGSTVK